VPFTPQSAQKTIAQTPQTQPSSSSALLPPDTMRNVNYNPSLMKNGIDHKLTKQGGMATEYSSPTSIADTNFTRADQKNNAPVYMEPLGSASCMGFLSNSFTEGIDRNYAPEIDYSPCLSSSSTSSEQSSDEVEDDERYDPISSELDVVSLINDDFALDGESYLGLLMFDEPPMQSSVSVYS